MKLPIIVTILTTFAIRANADVFSAAERARLVAFWSAPERYVVSAPPDAAKKGPWQVRLTPEASQWFMAYQKAVVGADKLPPTQDFAAVTPDIADWETWVKARLIYDRWSAQSVADKMNSAVLGTNYASVASAVAPPIPAPIPPGLLTAAGNPPPLASFVAPKQFAVQFDEGDRFVYQDWIAMRPRFAYYRFANGTAFYGTPVKELPGDELASVFKAAGFSDFEQHVMTAVSKLEGGFDAINTYDSGYVSVGFIQFIFHADGKHSLSEVMKQERTDSPDEYAKDFRQFGIDLNADGFVTVVDPSTGAELVGKEGVAKLIDDKRLVAVFQRAGKRSIAFRVAQVRVAKSYYWPADDVVRVTINGKALIGKVADVIKSEAGMTTMFDRKVNRGNTEPIGAVLQRVMDKHGLKNIIEAAEFEREIITALRFRRDFLLDGSLGHPK